MHSRQSSLASTTAATRVVPMHNTSLMTPEFLASSQLKDFIASAGTPKDYYDNHYFIRPLNLPKEAAQDAILAELCEEYLPVCAGARRQHGAIEAVKDHLIWVLLNLAYCSLTRQHLVVPMTTNGYSNNQYLKRFSYRAMKTVLDGLEATGVITKRKGAKYDEEPMATRFFPSGELQWKLIHIALLAQESFEPPYVEISKPLEDWQGIISKSEQAELVTINEFLGGHAWACKGPVRLKYKGDIFHSGRLYTRFQNLPSRKIAIRLNTLIDGEPICEVDYSANHVRLALAVMSGEDAGDDPYSEIADACDVERREVKDFFTRAIGADDKGKAFHATYGAIMNKAKIERIEKTFMQRFPKIPLYVGFGTNLQSMEGAIMKAIMLRGVKDCIVTLPIHDAIAVQARHQDWAKEVMIEAWLRHARKAGCMAYPRVKASMALVKK